MSDFELPEELKPLVGLNDLNKLPQHMKRYKCPICMRAGFTEKKCPNCGEETALIIMCPVDHCDCHHLITEKLSYCPICGQPMCPVCGTHDVFQLTRITGYINDIGGFNNAKAQEVKDRVRSNVINGEYVVEGDRNNERSRKTQANDETVS